MATEMLPLQDTANLLTQTVSKRPATSKNLTRKIGENCKYVKKGNIP